ncbi:MAG: DUF2066 domain-containing protein [Hyphomicrobium sp.]|jgi:hypothetical protein
MVTITIASAYAAPAARAVAAGSRVFTIAAYPVEATAKDAVAAKEKAHTDGQQAALGALFKRLVPVTAYNQLGRVAQVNAAQFIDGVAVRSESNSSTRYIASLDFTFQADAVRELLQREGVPFVEQQAPQLVLIPIMSEGGKYRAAGGSWNQVWKGLDLENTLSPVKVEPLAAAITPAAIQTTMGGGGVDQAFASYRANYLVVAAAEVDNASKRLEVVVAGEDATGPFSWKHSYRLQDGDVAYTMELAAVITLGVLEGRWKAANSDASGVGEAALGSAASAGPEIQIEAEFASVVEWNDMRGRILDLPGVDDIRIGSVSEATAQMSLRYQGGAAALAAAFSAEGLVLTGSGNQWRLRTKY